MLDTPEVRACVLAYLMARAYAETMREKVDEIHGEILRECPLTNDLDVKHGLDEPRALTDPSKAYLCTDEVLLADYYAESDKRLRAAKLKPDDMPATHCPALVAERLQTEAEWALIKASGGPLGVTNNGLLQIGRGLEKREQWIGLVVSFILDRPGFEAPKL